MSDGAHGGSSLERAAWIVLDEKAWQSFAADRNYDEGVKNIAKMAFLQGRASIRDNINCDMVGCDKAGSFVFPAAKMSSMAGLYCFRGTNYEGPEWEAHIAKAFAECVKSIKMFYGVSILYTRKDAMMKYLPWNDVDMLEFYVRQLQESALLYKNCVEAENKYRKDRCYTAVARGNPCFGWEQEMLTKLNELPLESHCKCPACESGKTLHKSDCAVHNGPAEPVGACDCGVLGKKATPRTDSGDLPKKITLMDIARTSHEAHREYSAAIGEPVKPWSNLTDEERNNVFSMVVFEFQNPDASPGDIHNYWVSRMQLAGWRHGKVKDPIQKTHPNMCVYGQLPAAQCQKIRLARDIVASLRYQVESKPSVEKQA